MHRFTLFSFFLLSLLCGLAAVGCGVENPMGAVGATVGGAEDIGYAREIIAAGGVPDADYIVAEGLYSQHDIPAPQGECKDRLCLSLGYGYAPAVDDGTENLFVHLGMGTNIKPEEFVRPPLQLALVVDRSSSMGGGSMESVKYALHSLVPKLTENDEVALVEFDHQSTLRMKARRMDEKGKKKLREVIDGIEIRGGTNIEAGLLDGYEEITQMTKRSGTEQRVILFTDAMPNVGSTDRDSFRGITLRYAEKGIGLTAFGVGIDFGQDLVYYISRLRGGNFFYLQNQERIREIFNEEFDYLVTPIVHDLQIRIETPPGAQLVQVYGLPDWKPGDRDAVLNIPTVFFSKNRGAIILRYKAATPGLYEVAPDQIIATGSISFTDPQGNPVSAVRELRHNGAGLTGDLLHFSHDGTRLATALTNTYLALHLACARFHAGDAAEALDVLDRGIALVTQENGILNNPGLAEEIALMERLRANIVSSS